MTQLLGRSQTTSALFKAGDIYNELITFFPLYKAILSAPLLEDVGNYVTDINITS